MNTFLNMDVDKSTCVSRFDDSVSKCKQYEKVMEECRADLLRGIIEFVNDLLCALPNEAILIVAKFYMETQVKSEKVMKKFVKKVLPVCDLVERRDEKFFLEGEYVDSILSNYKINLDFRSIWNKLNKDNQVSIWDWFNCFVKTAKQYTKHEKMVKSIQALRSK